ncbi:TetR/AcrR family transcriptional regulator [Alkalicella caledoniensis]|uniref:TetR/AcrR family transcriptional regulator n=1 Tax=Alkalicella caledoniensis TaxID=2731377 RepID=A0A7G9W5I9_ALKCA|nr:TetR/AcrR family transcriptional regulator [Alkalicella caledoniensis]QNO13951.1 TetR/AcrR family transcriptional regulator [Alkalicella caledoniensis]
MAKGFTEREKIIITNNLLERGKELFSVFGIKKTSIGDLTKAVGIAQGSFYSFFNSKEELYFEILEKEEKILKEKILKNFNIYEADASSFKDFLLSGLREVEKNTFLKTLYNRDEFELIVRKLPEEKIAKHIATDGDDLLPLIQYWQQKGMMEKFNPDAIAGVIRALFLLSTHKKEIGDGVYDETLELIITLIANGLFKGRE